ncbi:MAG TPA: hypothetical protein VFU21_24300 [Kofleriaceae bacterium]|nr:hypothetical protein [Kofleriaceae bacterium]
MNLPTGLLLAAAALSTACGGGEGASPTRSSGAPARAAIAAPRAGEYAVVSPAVDFFAAPRRGALHFRARAEPRSADPGQDFAEGVVLRVRGSRGGWIEVENPSLAEVSARHCREALGGLDPFELRFFVPADALAAVVTRRFRKTYADGTAVDLMPGMPLGGAAAGGKQVSRRAFGLLTVDLPPDAVGRSYPAAGAGLAGQFRRAAERAASVESDQVLAGGARLRAGPHDVVTAVATTTLPRKVAGGLVVTLADPCARVTARAAPDDIGAFGIGGAGGALADTMEGHLTDHDTRYLYPGVALFWEDGSPAGTARAPRRYDLWRRHPTRQELACIVHDLLHPSRTMAPNEPAARDRPRAPTELTLCFRHDDTKYRWDD